MDDLPKVEIELESSRQVVADIQRLAIQWVSSLGDDPHEPPPPPHHNREWARIRQAKPLTRDGYRCQACGMAGRLEAHHVVELAKGGTNDLANLRTLCRGCHIDSHRHVEDGAWMAMVKELADV